MFKKSDFVIKPELSGYTVSLIGRQDSVHIYDYKLITELINHLVHGVLPRNPFLRKCARNLLSSMEFGSLGQGKRKQKFLNQQKVRRNYA